MTTNNLYFLKTDPTFNSFLTLDHAFTRDECEKIIAQCEGLNKRTPEAGKDHKFDVGRQCMIADLDYDEKNSWIYQRVMEIINTVNYQSYNYDIITLETIQYSSYEKQGDQYGKHMDLNVKELPLTRIQRKLSFSIYLDEPDAYEGGYHLAWSDENKTQINQVRGAITIHPSWLVNQITPIERGVRRSLDGWLSGPAFR